MPKTFSSHDASFRMIFQVDGNVDPPDISIHSSWLKRQNACIPPNAALCVTRRCHTKKRRSLEQFVTPPHHLGLLKLCTVSRTHILAHGQVRRRPPSHSRPMASRQPHYPPARLANSAPLHRSRDAFLLRSLSSQLSIPASAEHHWRLDTGGVGRPPALATTNEGVLLNANVSCRPVKRRIPSSAIGPLPPEGQTFFFSPPRPNDRRAADPRQWRPEVIEMNRK